MIDKINLFFTRDAICNIIEELSIISKKSGIIKPDEVSVDIRTGSSLNAKIKPFEYREELGPIKDCKGKLDTVNVILPFNSEKMDKLYSRQRKISSMYGDNLGLRFPSINNDSWDYHNLEIYSLPLCYDNKVKYAIMNDDTYKSRECSNCQDELKNYCKNIKSIIKKNALPTEIEFEFTGEQQ